MIVGSNCHSTDKVVYYNSVPIFLQWCNKKYSMGSNSNNLLLVNRWMCVCVQYVGSNTCKICIQKIPSGRWRASNKTEAKTSNLRRRQKCEKSFFYKKQRSLFFRRSGKYFGSEFFFSIFPKSGWIKDGKQKRFFIYRLHFHASLSCLNGSNRDMV